MFSALSPLPDFVSITTFPYRGSGFFRSCIFNSLFYVELFRLVYGSSFRAKYNFDASRRRACVKIRKAIAGG